MYVGIGRDGVAAPVEAPDDVPPEVEAAEDVAREEALWAGLFLCAAGGFFLAGLDAFFAEVVDVGDGVVGAVGVLMVVTGGVAGAVGAT